MDKRITTIKKYDERAHRGGFRVAGSENFKGYSPVMSAVFLAHDLFHHHHNETGSMWEEMRALGASLHYELEGSNRRLLQSKGAAEYIETTLLREGLENIPTLPVAAGLPEDAVAHYSALFSEEMRDLLLAIMACGYHGAVLYPLEAYKKVQSYDMNKLLSASEIQIDLQTGEYQILKENVSDADVLVEELKEKLKAIEKKKQAANAAKVPVILKSAPIKDERLEKLAEEILRLNTIDRKWARTKMSKLTTQMQVIAAEHRVTTTNRTDAIGQSVGFKQM
jgi:hypothetical protein